ncbi:MAG: hypothetical protein HGA67_02835 [Candidatus Yonathbacteria bacterium]|nr:hypothetical protein [Candidatus Yonathbacteria bacterium]
MSDGLSNKQAYRKPKLCVSGAAATTHCGSDATEKAKELGRQIALQGGILLTGATTGFPFWAAAGAKEAGGVVIGFSPASGEREHKDVYRLPLEYHDLIIYTGFGYAGRDLLLTRSADAVLIGCGRIGTVHEFTIAFEDGKPIGVLEGSWEMDETLREMIARSHRKAEHVVFSKTPESVVADTLALVERERIQGVPEFSYRRFE